MENPSSSHRLKSHFDPGTIAFLLSKADLESKAWLRLMANQQEGSSIGSETQIIIAKSITTYLKGFRLAHQSIIDQLKKRHPEEVTQFMDEGKHASARLSEFMRETLELVPEIEDPTTELKEAIQELAKCRQRLVKYAVIAERIMQQQEGQTEYDINLEAPAIELDGKTIVLSGGGSSVNLTDQSEPVDALPAEESEQT